MGRAVVTVDLSASCTISSDRWSSGSDEISGNSRKSAVQTASDCVGAIFSLKEGESCEPKIF